MLVFFKNQQEEINIDITSTDFTYNFALPLIDTTPQVFVTTKDEFYAQNGTDFSFDIFIMDKYLNQYDKDLQFKLFITPDSNKFTTFKSKKITSKN